MCRASARRQGLAERDNTTVSVVDPWTKSMSRRRKRRRRAAEDLSTMMMLMGTVRRVRWVVSTLRHPHSLRR